MSQQRLVDADLEPTAEREPSTPNQTVAPQAALETADDPEAGPGEWKCSNCGVVVDAEKRPEHIQRDCTEIDRSTIHSRE